MWGCSKLFRRMVFLLWRWRFSTFAQSMTFQLFTLPPSSPSKPTSWKHPRRSTSPTLRRVEVSIQCPIISMSKNPFTSKYSNEYTWCKDMAWTHGHMACFFPFFIEWIIRRGYWMDTSTRALGAEKRVATRTPHPKPPALMHCGLNIFFSWTGRSGGTLNGLPAILTNIFFSIYGPVFSIRKDQSIAINLFIYQDETPTEHSRKYVGEKPEKPVGATKQTLSRNTQTIPPFRIVRAQWSQGCRFF